MSDIDTIVKQQEKIGKLIVCVAEQAKRIKELETALEDANYELAEAELFNEEGTELT